jgi:protein-tyrosine phosphatase
MNQSSFFIEKKALFGGYPNHKQLIELKKEGVVWFVDLTHKYEKNIKTYSHLVNNWINYPIKDGHIPEDKKKFTIFLFIIQMILESLKPGEKLYLHCRGGHGRSSMVIACLLSILLNILPDESLNLVNEYHNLRPNLSSKWLTRRPLNLKQQKFVEAFFGSLYLYSNFQNPYDHDVNTTNDNSQDVIHPCKRTKFRSMVILNFYLHQHPTILEVLLNSGFKKIQGEGMTSVMLQELRFYILYFQAKKIFDLT